MLVGVGAVLAGYVALSPRAIPARTEAEPSVPVVTAAVTQEDVAIALTGLGTVQALNKAVIRSQVTGLLEAVDFTEGKAVKRGDVLARIDPRIYQAKLDQAKAQRAHDQALLANQQTNLQRDEPLLRRGYATDRQVTGEQAGVAQTESTQQADQAAIDAAATELDFATLRAPFDGVTGLRLIDIGNVVHPTDPGGIVVLTQVQPISVVFTLPTHDIGAVQAALDRGRVSVTVYDQAGTRQLDTGTLLLVDNEAAANSGTVRLKATFPNSGRQLWPGAFVNAQVTLSIVKAALTVPTNAIQRNDTGQFVFVVGPDQTVSPRLVEVSQRVRGVALVSEGLKAGETVVAQGQYRLTPGVTVVAESPAKVADTTTASAGMLP
ncbi:efflux RND transporter periplasmic adaptor subunit [Methylobacterium sp. 77]|uniref:efflux RND transporter periplasmic adaptor subunit n=1 Tax=Methylobacterium sp. 77 TaxID=1101192 RepID=UPI00036E42C6|nr:efflux RND transporter periplasmic adaptor subunit [Methylobacterium sp. 77]